MVMTSCHGQILREQSIRRDIGTPHVSPKSLKGLVRDRLNTCIVFSACVDSDRSNYNAVTDYSCEDSPCHGQDGDFWIHNNNWSVNDSSIQPSSASRRRQSRILDQWAARQAREMITTIERQACEAELMALSSVQPVSARSSSFLQETSPPRLECSVELPNLRASSLVQMWRELEAEARMTRESSISSTNSAASTRTYALSSVDNGEEPYGSSEVCDSADERSDSFTDADSDVAAPSESERGRVFDLVRRLNLGSPKINPFSSCSDEPPREEQSPSDRRDNMGLRSNGNRRLIRGRQATKDFLVLINRGRQRELARLFEQCAVSRFSHRSRIQALLKFRLLQREVVVQERKHPTSTSYELDQLQLGTPISRLRERFSSTSKKENCSHPVFEGSSSFRSVDSERSGLSEQLSIENNHDIEIATRDHEGTLSLPNSLPSTSEDLQEEAHQRSELSLQERNLNNQNLDSQYSMNTDTSLNGDDWEGDAVAEEPDPETSLHGGWEQDAVTGEPDPDISLNNDWEGGDTVTEEPDHDTQTDIGEEYADGTWSTDDPHPQSGRTVVREAMYQEWLLSMSDNDEIRELLDRRTVSTTLASGFKERMDQMILSHLRGIANQSIDDSIAREEYHNSFQLHDHSYRLGDLSIDDSVTIEEDHGLLQLHNHLQSPDNQTIDDCVIGDDAQNPLNIYDYDNQVPYTSIQLPLPSGYSRYQGNLAENSSFMHQSPPHLQLNLYDPSLNHLDDHSQSLADPSINGSVTREENHNIFLLHDHLQSPTNQTIDDRNDDSQVASSPIQLPLSSRYSQCRGHLQQNSSFMPKSPHCSLEMELIHELRGDVVQLHQEMHELRRSIESCINMQTQLKNVFNQDVSTAACHSGGPGDSIRKGSCCICYEMQVDSLLYRCGHMCTCFKCAHELQWSSGTCPICRAPIVDVVRAYSDV